MNKKYWMRFLAPDDGGGAGGGGEPSRGMTALEDGTTPGEGGDEPAEPAGEPAAEPAVAPSVDAKALATEFGAQLRDVFKDMPKGDEPTKITPEEAKKLLKVWDPDDSWYARFDNLETRKAAVAEMRDNLVLQSDTLTQHRLQEVQTALEKKFSPMMERLQKMDEEARETRFDSSYPQLAKPALRPLLQAVAKQMKDQTKQFDSEVELFKALASGMEAVIKETNPDFKLTTAGSTPATSKPRTGGIPVTTPGSGGGTAPRGTEGQSKKARGLAVFDS